MVIQWFALEWQRIILCFDLRKFNGYAALRGNLRGVGIAFRVDFGKWLFSGLRQNDSVSSYVLICANSTVWMRCAVICAGSALPSAIYLGNGYSVVCV